MPSSAHQLSPKGHGGERAVMTPWCPEAAPLTHTEQLSVSYPPWKEHDRVAAPPFPVQHTFPVQQQVTVRPPKNRTKSEQRSGRRGCAASQPRQSADAPRRPLLAQRKTWPCVSSASGAKKRSYGIRPTRARFEREGWEGWPGGPWCPSDAPHRQGARTVAAVVCPGGGRVWGRGAVGRGRLKVEHF